MNEWIPAKVNDNSSTKIVSKLLRFIVGGSDEWKYFGKGSKVSRIKWLCYGNLFYKTLFLSTLASDCSFLCQSVFVCPPQFQLLSSLSIRQVDKYIMINNTAVDLSTSSPNFNSHDWPRKNVSLQYQYKINQLSVENKEKYQFGDN